MRSLFRPRSTVALLAVVLVSAPATATVTTVGCAGTAGSCTLDELIGGGALRVGSLELSGWTIDDASDVPLAAGAIDVLGLERPSGMGVRIDSGGAIAADGFDLVDLVLRFTVEVSAGAAAITGSSLTIDGFGFDAGNDGGFVTVFEDLLGAGGAAFASSFVTADNLPPQTFVLSDSAAFAPARSFDVRAAILAAGDGPSDGVRLDGLTLLFSSVAVPEPGALTLVALGVVGFAGAARRRRAVGSSPGPNQNAQKSRRCTPSSWRSLSIRSTRSLSA